MAEDGPGSDTAPALDLDPAPGGAPAHHPPISALVPSEVVLGIFHLTPRALFDWDRRGWLHPVRLGRRKFYRADEVAQLVAHGTPKNARHSNK